MRQALTVIKILREKGFNRLDGVGTMLIYCIDQSFFNTIKEYESFKAQMSSYDCVTITPSKYDKYFYIDVLDNHKTFGMGEKYI